MACPSKTQPNETKPSKHCHQIKGKETTKAGKKTNGQQV